MEIPIRYRGRTLNASDVEFVRRLIKENPRASRRGLSVLVCRAWNWVQPNGSLRDMVARGLLLQLERQDHIRLPPRRHSPPNNIVRHRRPPVALLPVWEPLEAPVSALRPLDVRQVRRTSEEVLFDDLLATHHYLGYTRPVGEHLKYLVVAGGTPVACLAWSSAPRHIGCRDRFIGWSAPVRRAHIHEVAYNTRFLVLPWARVPHLASHVLGRVARTISADWERIYGHPVWFLETFVDPGRFRGTCYRAANWILLGVTTGRGKDDRTNRPNRPIKQVFGYPLAADFRQMLGVQ